jgi:hypothetical protein
MHLRRGSVVKKDKPFSRESCCHVLDSKGISQIQANFVARVILVFAISKKQKKIKCKFKIIVTHIVSHLQRAVLRRVREVVKRAH